MSRKITFLTLFLWLMTVTFPVIAQQKADTTYTFRFVPDGKLPLYVDGYCNSLGSETENLATAKIRANRVKSELITRAEIKEENFITRNHATEGDFVTVRLTVPVKETAATDAEAEARRKAEAERLEAEKRAGNSRDGCGSRSTTQGGSRTSGSREACRTGTACRRAAQGGRSPTCR